jgi:hypothetical protein
MGREGQLEGLLSRAAGLALSKGGFMNDEEELPDTPGRREALREEMTPRLEERLKFFLEDLPRKSAKWLEAEAGAEPGRQKIWEGDAARQEENNRPLMAYGTRLNAEYGRKRRSATEIELAKRPKKKGPKLSQVR